MCVCLCFVSNRQDVYRSGSGSIRKVPRSCKPHSEVNNLYFFSSILCCCKVRVFQCDKMWCAVFKASSVKHWQIIYFWVLLETREKFIHTVRSTQKAGMFFKTLLVRFNWHSKWVGCDKIFWTHNLPRSKNFNVAGIRNMQPIHITGQHKLWRSALESSTSSRWFYGMLHRSMA